MKKLRISLTATMAVLLLISITCGFAAAQTTEGSFVKGFLTNSEREDGSIHAGDTVKIFIFYRNNSTETVILDYAGVHFDWMPTDSLYGFNVSSYDIQVASGEDYYFQQQINMRIPTSANGNHSYYAGIDGHTAASTPVSLSSEPVEFMVIGTGPTTVPTSTNSGNQGGVPDIVFYGVIIAVVAVVVVVLLVVFIRRKGRPASKPSEPAASQPAPTQPGETPSGQDFSI